MQVELAYGKSGLTIEVPEERTTVIEPAYLPALPDVDAALLDACLDLYRAGAGERFLGAGLHFAHEIADRFFDAARVARAARQRLAKESA